MILDGAVDSGLDTTGLEDRVDGIAAELDGGVDTVDISDCFVGVDDPDRVAAGLGGGVDGVVECSTNFWFA